LTKLSGPSDEITKHDMNNIRDVHGNRKDWDPMGFPWEWEYDQPWDGNWNKTHGNGIGN